METESQANDTEDDDQVNNNITTTPPPSTQEQHFFVYLLFCAKATRGGKTYVGATVNLDHRLRQHNGEIKGGAIATTSQVGAGYSWIRLAHVAGFPTWQAALQFEWRWKQISRKYENKIKHPVDRRAQALRDLLALPQSTSKAIPYAAWPSGGPVVHVESELFPWT